jgi:hypothetical protein
MASNYGAFSELPKSAPAVYNYGAYSEMPTASTAPVKARTNYKDRAKQAKAYKPNNVSATATSNFTYSSPVGPRKVESFRAGERTATAPKKIAKVKDTSFAKSGVAGVLKSPAAKKARATFAKKGLIPALRGK